MSDRIPPGAFPESRDAEQQIAQAVLGKTFKAFDSRSRSLADMRTAVNEHDDRIGAVEAALKRLPFPFRES